MGTGQTEEPCVDRALIAPTHELLAIFQIVAPADGTTAATFAARISARVPLADLG
jgi:hypothetical protein